MTELRFTKMHGAGNDFVVLDGVRDELPPIEQIAARLCDRHLGIGADQLLVVRPASFAQRAAGERRPSDASADFRMEIWNADGSQVEMCANGIRAFYKYLRDHGLTSRAEIGVETLSGVVRPRWAGADRVIVDMGRPILAPAKIPTTLASFAQRAQVSRSEPQASEDHERGERSPSASFAQRAEGERRPSDSGDGPVLDVPLAVDGQTLLVSSVSMGNPHAVIYVDDPETTPVERWGRVIEHHAAFPNRVNVEFVRVLDRGRIAQRTWERGAGETLACGSGACAVAVVSMLRGVVDRRVSIELRGGVLEIAWPSDDAHVEMTGPAAEVFTGVIQI